MPITLQSLIISHSAVFTAGFIAGKLIDYGELHTYRMAHESYARRWQRQAAAASMGIVAIGGVVMFLRASRRQVYYSV
jgi:hypothetical protein